MKDEFRLASAASASDPRPLPELVFHDPYEVLVDPDLTPAERQAILASWASDLGAMDGPRRAGTCLDEVLKALRTLDERAGAVIDQFSTLPPTLG